MRTKLMKIIKLDVLSAFLLINKIINKRLICKTGEYKPSHTCVHINSYFNDKILKRPIFRFSFSYKKIRNVLAILKLMQNLRSIQTNYGASLKFALGLQAADRKTNCFRIEAIGRILCDKDWWA